MEKYEIVIINSKYIILEIEVDVFKNEEEAHERAKKIRQRYLDEKYDDVIGYIVQVKGEDNNG